VIDCVRFPGKFGKLCCRFRRQLLGAHFEPLRQYCKLGAQLIFDGANFGDRTRRGRFEAPHHLAHGSVMHERNEQQFEQRRNEEPNPKIDDRFDDNATPLTIPNGSSVLERWER